ncbi:coiled-coil domain-containing protein 152-like [Dendronephthya gigantea]|uniref:coiled-coil domain-containing protein 152-like n=1 Tax=Dendronephthya gigantea TaxID=151771 RepID=UPI00106B7476|nr:coiled-coil domain-containing protein 152-like [Dendronephthya gigantea]
MEASNEQIDLREFVSEFLSWQKTIKKLAKDNSYLKVQFTTIQKQLQKSQIAEKTANEKCLQLREMVNKLQTILDIRNNMQDENVKLKKQLVDAKEMAINLEQSHKCQMNEAIKNLEASQQAHAVEIKRLQENNQLQNKREVSLLEKEVQEKNGEIRELCQKLSDIERDKHTEIVKLRLEYDAKLLKVQKSSSKQQPGSNATANNEIFRKKLQYVKVQAEKEVAMLKNKIMELERKLVQQTNQQDFQHLPQKRRRLTTMGKER